ncbi:MAG TPA: hypothetical protein VGK88_12500 [bacterium]
MARRMVLTLMVGGGAITLAALMYAVGFHAGAQAATPPVGPVAVLPVQSPPPLQEFIPIPMPGQGPDDQQGRGQDDQGQCQPTILFYYQGRLYQLQPQPGQGPQGQRGRPGSPPEYFPLTPYQGPAIPGLPGIPFGPQQQGPLQIPMNPPPGPTFQPQNPRF